VYHNVIHHEIISFFYSNMGSLFFMTDPLVSGIRFFFQLPTFFCFIHTCYKHRILAWVFV